jgi:hypothetical protein
LIFYHDGRYDNYCHPVFFVLLLRHESHIQEAYFPTSNYCSQEIQDIVDKIKSLKNPKTSRGDAPDLA